MKEHVDLVQSDRIEKTKLYLKEYMKKQKEKQGGPKVYYKSRDKISIKERQQKYYEVNKEKIKIRKKAYYERTKDKNKERQRRFYYRNKERVNAIKKDYYKRSKEKIIKRGKVYREINSVMIKEKQNEYRGANVEKTKQYFREYYERNKEKMKEQHKMKELKKVCQDQKKVYQKVRKSKIEDFKKGDGEIFREKMIQLIQKSYEKKAQLRKEMLERTRLVKQEHEEECIGKFNIENVIKTKGLQEKFTKILIKDSFGKWCSFCLGDICQNPISLMDNNLESYSCFKTLCAHYFHTECLEDMLMNGNLKCTNCEIKF